MPTKEVPSYSSSRVQRASRLNALEQTRLQQRLMLLEKARLHQVRLTNQDIRLTSIALEYILNCSGHSPEGRGPGGQQGGVEVTQGEEPCFLYGERVVSRKVRRMPRPHSATDKTSFTRTASHDSDSLGTSGELSSEGRSRLPPRPQSSPAKGRWWEEGERSPVSSRPSTAGGMTPGRNPPRQAWEEDTEEITKKLLKAQRMEERKQQQQLQQQNARRSRRYMQDIGRRRPPSAGSLFPRKDSASSSLYRPMSSAASSSVSPRAPSPSPSVIEDRKPVPPGEKPGRSGQANKRAGLVEIMNQSQATLSAGAWRSHLANSPQIPRSAHCQRELVMQARRQAERGRQHHVLQRVETFMDQLNATVHATKSC